MSIILATASSFKAIPNDGIGFKVSFSKSNPAVGDTLDIIFTASVPENFHVFSEKSDCPADDGPLRAEWMFDPAGGIQFIGKPVGVGDRMVKDNEIFMCSTGEFSKTCQFRQKIVITGAVHNIQAHFTGQKCSDKDGTCFLIKEDVFVPLHVH